jgi:hypothetical protein
MASKQAIVIGEMGASLCHELRAEPDRVNAGSAARGHDMDRTLRTDLAGDLDGEAARHHLLVEERGRIPLVDLVQATAVTDDPVLLVERHRRSDGGAHRHPDAVRRHGVAVQTAGRERLADRRDRQLAGTVDAARLVRREAVGDGVEVDLCGHL